MAQRYSISFDTLDAPGRVKSTWVKSTWVELGTQFMRDRDTMRDRDIMRVDLCDHPLYPKLEEYVLNNPSGKMLQK